MNKSKILNIALGLMASTSVLAAPLTPAQSLQRAAASDGPRKVAYNLNPEPVYTMLTETKQPALYVFEKQNGTGYEILSGSDIAFPVLGYSDAGKFDPENINPELKWWLGEYAQQIEWAEKNNAKYSPYTGAQADWTAISPLCKSKWDQGSPYDKQCPVPASSTTPCPTGCVATSMAQVMYYHKYPECGTGLINYRTGTLNRTLVLNLDKYPFDWDNMLDIYETGCYNDAQADAVAYLMKAVGYSVSMNYTPEASGASGVVIGASLRQYFKYDEGCHSAERALYSMSEWAEKIYTNLKEVGPVIVNGRDFDGSMGHSFVCDGYDGKGMYHFNWGWGGMSDGYFSLNALNPDAMGTGGYGGGFNTGQNAIFGIQPPTGKEYQVKDAIMQYGNSYATVSGNKLIMGAQDYAGAGWANATDYVLTGKVGVRYELVGSSDEPIIVDGMFNTYSTMTFSTGGGVYTDSNYKINSTIPGSLTDGTYKVTLMFKPNDGEWDEVIPTWGYNNYVFFKKEGNSYSVEKAPVMAFTVSEAEIASKLYYGKKTLLKVKYNNVSDMELSQGVVPRLYKDGVLCMEGAGVLVTVDANESVERTFVSRLNVVGNYKFSGTTEFDFVLYDPINRSNYGTFGKVTMQKAPDALAVMFDSFIIEDAQVESVAYGEGQRDSYLIKDPANFTADLDYTVRMGYLDGKVKLAIYKLDPENLNRLMVVVDDVYSEEPFLSAGESGSIKTKISFPEAEKGVIYALRGLYLKSSTWTTLGTIYFAVANPEGVDLIVDDAAEAEYFNLQGQSVKSPQPGQLVIRKVGNKVEKVIF